MNRIKPEVVRKAYSESGFKPIQGVYFSPDNKCACAFGAIYKVSNLEILDGMCVDNFGVSTTGSSEYYGGFLSGFDGEDDPQLDEDDEYQIGWKDGKAAWEVVKDLA